MPALQAVTAVAPAGELDAPAYLRDLRARLSAAEPITAQDLSTLADARAKAVIDYLGGQELAVATRTVLADSQTSELDEGGRLTMQFTLTAQARTGDD